VKFFILFPDLKFSLPLPIQIHAKKDLKRGNEHKHCIKESLLLNPSAINPNIKKTQQRQGEINHESLSMPSTSPQ
jgi:hypothetical protein